MPVRHVFAVLSAAVGFYCCSARAESMLETFQKADLLNFKEKKPLLAKENAAAAAGVPYSNTDYNFTYTPPAGWRIDSTRENSDEQYSEKYLMVFVSNPSYNSRVTLVAFKAKNGIKGEMIAYKKGFRDFYITYVVDLIFGSTSAPFIYNVKDSTGDTAVFNRLLFDKIKYADGNSISVNYYQSRGAYVIEMYYATSSSDYSLNAAGYLRNFYNANFIALGVGSASLPKLAGPLPSIICDNEIVSVSVARQQQVKLRLFDLQGREMQEIFNGTMAGSKTFRLPAGSFARQNAVISLEAGRESVSKMVNTR